MTLNLQQKVDFISEINNVHFIFKMEKFQKYKKIYFKSTLSLKKNVIECLLRLHRR